MQKIGLEHEEVIATYHIQQLMYGLHARMHALYKYICMHAGHDKINLKYYGYI